MFFVLGGKYTVDSNKEYGLGRYDIILIPKDKSKTGYIFEFKATDNASKLGDEVESALSQITDSRCYYGARLRQEDIMRVHYVGIAFCGKEMHMDSEIHDYYHQQPQQSAVLRSSLQ
jgi:PD-(D/E)XK nuclease superfamily